MKKSTIWIIAAVMGFSFLALIFLQLKYIQQMARMKKEQFDEYIDNKYVVKDILHALELGESKW